MTGVVGDMPYGSELSAGHRIGRVTIRGVRSTGMWVQRVHLGMARKNIAFKIRLSEELRREFADACRTKHRPAAQVVRELMREYIAAARTVSHRPDIRTTATEESAAMVRSGE